MSIETRHVKYAFADVVSFTQNRTVDAQVEIVSALNQAFRSATTGLETIYLPTGDGICAGIIAQNAPPDAHIQAALHVISFLSEWSAKAGYDRKCTVRFGINESVDTLITDINNARNLAGAGINQAQRLMSVADGNQIIVGKAAYETLVVRDRYTDAFRQIKTKTKDETVLTAYQFIKKVDSNLNIELPWSVKRVAPIDIEMIESLSRKENYSTPGQIRATIEATEQWNSEMAIILDQVSHKCTDSQKNALSRSQIAWEQHYNLEKEFLNTLRETVRGTMYRPIHANIRLELVRRRVKTLTWYTEELNESAS